MAQYLTKFSEYVVDAQPSDWTARFVSANNNWATRAKAGTEGGRVLENTGTVDGRHLLSWDVIDADATRADAEILVRFRSSSSVVFQAAAMIRASGAAGSENSYQFWLPSSGGVEIAKYASGVAANLGSASFTFTTNTFYYARFRVFGTAQKLKVWADGVEEPTTWLIETTDSAITDPGWVGVANFESTGIRDYDYVSIATNGETANLAHGDTPTRFSQVVAEVAFTQEPRTRFSQVVAEVAFTQEPRTRFSQLVIEVAYSTAPASVQQPRMVLLL